MIIQPCDWVERDDKYKYVVDVFGRTNKNEVAQVRITGFKPYYYLKSPEKTPTQLIEKLKRFNNDKPLYGLDVELVERQDMMGGFNYFSKIRVWKLSFPSLYLFRNFGYTLKKHYSSSDIYECNLPAIIRLFHVGNLLPGDPFEFDADDYEPDEDTNVDVFYTVDYESIKPVQSKIPLYVCSYDLEVYSDSGNFPVASNDRDEIIQIGISFRYSDDLLTSVKRYVLVSGTCEGEYISCKDERTLLKQFREILYNENPDCIVGYNTFGFDDAYLAQRCKRYKLDFNMGRIARPEIKTEKKTFELASGKFEVEYIENNGRLVIDLYLLMRRDYILDSYKLDNIASTFLSDRVVRFERRDNKTIIHTKNTRGLFSGNYVQFSVVTHTTNPYNAKYTVSDVTSKSFAIDSIDLFNDLESEMLTKLEWSFAKDDISPHQIFEYHRTGPRERSLVAKYCIQDCDLVLNLMSKLDVVAKISGMANVCMVPISYVLLRGLGIKIFSACVYIASTRNQIIGLQQGGEDSEETSYEGAIVLPPKIGMYLDQPIPVLDFNSLYPSNMIAYNLSPDTLVYIKTCNQLGKVVSHIGLNANEVKQRGFVIDEISYDNKEQKTRIICGFIQPSDDPRTVGILPTTLNIMLKKRKEIRVLMESETDEFQRSIYNNLQLAYKTVANSIYGQCGSRTSPIRKLEIAACTTAAGRSQIQFAKNIVETEFNGEIIYGDTDSIFIKFPTRDLAESIKLGQQSAARITSLCRKPYKIEYEKTFYPFILFCRKRYIGNMYEDDVNKYHRKNMGVVLKRRDNAPIVKDVFGGAVDILLEQKNVAKAVEFVKQKLTDLLQFRVPIEKFVISKQLRDDYKNPDQIAHRVLANRMKERDGTAPQVGDRLAYVHVHGRDPKLKQGERIENLDYVVSKKLKPDVEFYVTNQIQKPVSQLFALVIEQISGYIPKKYEIDETLDEETNTLKILDKKERELESILFMKAQYLSRLKRGPMDNFITRF